MQESLYALRTLSPRQNLLYERLPIPHPTGTGALTQGQSSGDAARRAVLLLAWLVLRTALPRCWPLGMAKFCDCALQPESGERRFPPPVATSGTPARNPPASSAETRSCHPDCRANYRPPPR